MSTSSGRGAASSRSRRCRRGRPCRARRPGADCRPGRPARPGCARNVISPYFRRSSRQATLSSDAVAAVPVEEHEPLRRRRRHAAADVVEHREQRRRRQPDRAGRPGVLVRLGVRSVGSSHRSSSSPAPATTASATALATTESVEKGRCGPCCSIAPSGWTMIAALGSRAAGHLRTGEVGEVSPARCYDARDADRRWAS